MTVDGLPGPVWVQVVTRAGRRCECTGACGHHAGRRCEASGEARRLVVAARDAGADPASAWRLPADALAAWCWGCYDAARRVALRKADRDARDDSPELFPVSAVAPAGTGCISRRRPARTRGRVMS